MVARAPANQSLVPIHREVRVGVHAGILSVDLHCMTGRRTPRASQRVRDQRDHPSSARRRRMPSGKRRLVCRGARDWSRGECRAIGRVPAAHSGSGSVAVASSMPLTISHDRPPRSWPSPRLSVSLRGTSSMVPKAAQVESRLQTMPLAGDQGEAAGRVLVSARWSKRAAAPSPTSCGHRRIACTRYPVSVSALPSRSAARAAAAAVQRGEVRFRFDPDRKDSAQTVLLATLAAPLSAPTAARRRGARPRLPPAGRDLRYTIGPWAQREILDLLELNHQRYGRWPACTTRRPAPPGRRNPPTPRACSDAPGDVGVTPPARDAAGLFAAGLRWVDPCGGMNSGSPSRIRQIHSVEWICRWWTRHSMTRLDTSVSPPHSHGTMWWHSHHDGGRSHPGCAQPRSRAATARRSPSGMVRVARPTSSG